MTRTFLSFLRRNRSFALIVALFSSTGLKAETVVGTFIVHPAPASGSDVADRVEEMLGNDDVGERYCHSLHCVVVAGTPVQRDR